MSEAISIHAQQAQFFDLKTPYLDQGRSRKNASATEVLTVVGMVYAEGGENAMHHHENEDHIFESARAVKAAGANMLRAARRRRQNGAASRI